MKDTIDMAREAGFTPARDEWVFMDMLTAFEALVRADEREVCAEVADYMAGRCKHPDEIADAIRARGNP